MPHGMASVARTTRHGYAKIAAQRAHVATCCATLRRAVRRCDVLCDVAADVLCDVAADVLCDVAADVLCDVAADVLCNVAADVLCNVAADVLCDVAAERRAAWFTSE
jgi:hypothetical protein